MTKNKVRLAVAATMLAVAAVPASAQAQTLENAKRYFVCQGAQPATKVQNSPFAQFGWSETKPTASFTTGAGCGYVDSAVTGTTTGDSVHDAPFGGTYNGAVKDLTVELHDLLLGHTEKAASGRLQFNVALKVGGADVLGAAGKTVSAVPVESASRLSHSVRFSIAGLNLPAVAAPDRPFVLTIRSGHGAGWVFGAAEIPSHVELNPASLEPAVVRP